LRAIKDAALRLIQLITIDIEERRKRYADSRMRYPDSGRYEKSNQVMKFLFLDIYHLSHVQLNRK